MTHELSDQIQAIPWRERKTASGDARDVPQALKDLSSEDQTKRDLAYWKLDNHVVLQGDLYEAARDVVPFLIEMLRAREPFGRDLIYDVLFEIANGYAPDVVQWRDPSGRDVPLRIACYSALSEGIEVFKRDANDSDPTVRRASTCLLDRLGVQEDGDHDMR
jgi:hypothetical protein